MALPSNVALRMEQELLLQADVLAQFLSWFGADEAERTKALLAEIVSKLELAVLNETDVNSGRASERRGPVLISSKSDDDTEEFILASLASSPRGLSVQDIVNLFTEAEIEIKRPTLVVRLHRLLQAGRLSSRTHGHYALSEAERDRRKSA